MAVGLQRDPLLARSSEVLVNDFQIIAATVNGSDSTVDFIYDTDGGASGSFSVDTGGPSKSVLLPEVAGTRLHVYVRDPDGEQVFVNVFGTY